MNEYRVRYVFNKDLHYEGTWFELDEPIPAENIDDAMDIAVVQIRDMVFECMGYHYHEWEGDRIESAQILITLTKGDSSEDELICETYFEWFDR